MKTNTTSITKLKPKEKKKQTSPAAFSAFSPNPAVRKSADLNLTKVAPPANENAMEKAQRMLSKYSSKPMPAAEPVSNFRQHNAKRFDEEDLVSMGSGEFSDMEMSDSEDFANKKKKPQQVHHCYLC